MVVEDYLTPKEKIVSQIKSSGYDFLATNKRVIKYKKTRGGENFEDLAYRHITSITLKGGINIVMIILGIILLFLVYIFRDNSLLFFIFLIFGIICIIVGLMSRSVYKLYASGINPSNWTITNLKTKEAKDFIKTIREYIEIEKE
jgi:hypothetical protein